MTGMVNYFQLTEKVFR
uniref:Uncharacterized protein n=1 Tax=Arundo donax TaxID=35708 RepID=A0A0A8ZCM4_ARUDO